MQIGPLTNLIADTLHEERKTVAVFVRELRNAGLLTTGARGVNAPHMLPIDAARIVLALLATDKPSRAVELVERFRAMPMRPEESSEDRPDILAGCPTLEQALVRLIAADIGEAPLTVYIEIRRWDKSAHIEIYPTTKAVFRGPRLDQMSDEDRRERFGKSVSCGLPPSALLKINVELWLDREKRGPIADWTKGA